MVAYSSSGIHVLSKHYALRLDDEEVDELLHIIEQTLQRGLGDGEVLAWAELGGETAAECQLSCNLSCCGRTKYHVESLQAVADDVEVSSGKDEDNGGGKGNTSGTGVLPAQEAVKQAVVVCRDLAW